MYQRATIFMIVLLLVTSGCSAPAAPSPKPPTGGKPTEQEVEPTTIASSTSLPSPIPTDPSTPWPTATPTPRPIGWVTFETAHSPVPRNGHATAMLPNGRVILFGGIDESGNALGDTWILDLNAGTQSSASGLHGLLSIILRPLMADWTPITPPDSPSARQGHSMVTLPDGRVLLFGGTDNQGAWFNDLHAFAADQWSPITPSNDPPGARAYHNAWVRGDEMYVLGGLGGQGLFDDLWRYDLLSNTWQQLQNPPDLILPSSYASPFLTESQGTLMFQALIVDPHSAAKQPPGKSYAYDMANNRWETFSLENVPEGKLSGYRIVQLDDRRAVMFGGVIWDPDTQTVVYSPEVYLFEWDPDARTGSFTRLEDMPIPLDHAEAVYDPLQNRIIIWGGEQSEGVLFSGSKTLIYYPEP